MQWYEVLLWVLAADAVASVVAWYVWPAYRAWIEDLMNGWY